MTWSNNKKSGRVLRLLYRWSIIISCPDFFCNLLISWPNFFLRSSRIRVYLLSYESIPTDKREQYDWRADKNLDGIRVDLHIHIFPPLKSYYSRLSVNLISYNNRSTLIRLDCIKIVWTGAIKREQTKVYIISQVEHYRPLRRPAFRTGRAVMTSHSEEVKNNFNVLKKYLHK